MVYSRARSASRCKTVQPLGSVMIIRNALGSRTNKVAGVMMAAAMIAAACGGDEEPTVAPVVPTETTATVPESDVTVSVQEESPSTTTTAAEETSEPESETNPTSETTPPEPESEPEPTSTTAAPGPAMTTPTSVPVVVVEDEGIADRALVFLAGELAVPESEITFTGIEPVTWPDASLGCPQEGYAYAQVLVPGYRITFSHDSVSYDVHSDEQGKSFVQPVGCYDPSEPEPTTTTPAPEPEPEPTTTTPAPEPELEPTTTTPAPEPEPVETTTTEQPTTTSAPEPEPATVENQPEQPATTPEPEQSSEDTASDDIVCSMTESGTVACPEAIPDDYICEGVSDGVVCSPPKPGSGDEQEPAAPAWTPPVAGVVPEVHPDTPLPEWQRGDGTVDPRRRAYDSPRATEIVVGWKNWCSWQNAVSCRWLLHEMYQAIDYLGASSQCVLNVYTDRVNYHVERGSGANFSYGTENFGWHLCSTVIDPIVFEIPSGKRHSDVGLRLSDTPGITLAERCRTVLTDPFPDIQLENRISQAERDRGLTPTQFGQDCDAWATWVIEDGPVRSAPACNASARLAEEWMEHHHNQHERYFGPHC